MDAGESAISFKGEGIDYKEDASHLTILYQRRALSHHLQARQKAQRYRTPRAKSRYKGRTNIIKIFSPLLSPNLLSLLSLRLLFNLNLVFSLRLLLSLSLLSLNLSLVISSPGMKKRRRDLLSRPNIPKMSKSRSTLYPFSEASRKKSST